WTRTAPSSWLPSSTCQPTAFACVPANAWTPVSRSAFTPAKVKVSRPESCGSVTGKRAACSFKHRSCRA
ncbi:MAG: hypothetical protein AVDCRST_MAG62-1122, partial [uncultured Sphingomonas sp.]